MITEELRYEERTGFGQAEKEEMEAWHEKGGQGGNTQAYVRIHKGKNKEASGSSKESTW